MDTLLVCALQFLKKLHCYEALPLSDLSKFDKAFACHPDTE